MSTESGVGVLGEGKDGVRESAAAVVFGFGNPGVLGESKIGDGVRGVSEASASAGVSAINDHGSFGIWARGTPAGNFEGNVSVNGNIDLVEI